jgi:branched-subunit amino acid aminotransferase/4-amino-4-deoxychorismate lyase
MANDVQVAIRIPQSLLGRAEALTKALRQNPDNALIGVTRTTILRLAISKGLDVLEEQAKTTR